MQKQNSGFNPKYLNKSASSLTAALCVEVDYYQGNLVTYNDWSAVGASEGINDDGTGRDWKYLESTYDVKTSKDIYRFAIKEYIKDTVDSDNIGIWSMYVIKMEDDTDPKIAYRGDNKDTPGINFNIKNMLPGEDPSISPVSINEQINTD